MAAVQCVLNVIAFVVVLTSRSFVAAKRARADCQNVAFDYVKNWTVRDARAHTLLKQDRSLSYEDVKGLFLPSCDMQGNYATRQCFMNAYCWCSDSDGKLLSGTFQKGTAEELDCTKCKVGNTSYKSGDSFKISERCEVCKCEDREVICHKYFCSNKTKLTPQELAEFKITLLKVFYVQYEHRNTQPIDIVKEEYITHLPLNLTLSYSKQRLHWKFNKLDINKDDKLNKDFEFIPLFMRKIQHFVKSRKVYDQIFSIIDEDNDMLISKHEWTTFFDNIIAPEDSDDNGSGTTDDNEGSGVSVVHIVTRSVKPSRRSLPEVAKEFIRKLRKQRRMSHSEDKYF